MRALPVEAATGSGEPWTVAARRCALQEPLLDSRSSLAGLKGMERAPAPRIIFVGVGLCSRGELSRGVPIDLLGMLLAAEALRRATDALEMRVLVADTHALENGFAPEAVEARARAVERVLQRIRVSCGLSHLTPLRASTLHRDPEYQRTLLQLRRRAPVETHEYLLQQFADVLHLHRRDGPLLKLGWSLPSGAHDRRRDEVLLDAQLQSVCDERIAFAYCKPGRTLADASPRMPPYVVKRPEARLCLDAPEDPAAKLGAANLCARPATVAGFRRHLGRLLYTFGRMVEPLPRGRLELRVTALMERVSAFETPALHEDRCGRRTTAIRRSSVSACPSVTR